MFKSKALCALAGVLMLGSVGVASAVEPVSLTDKQMDSVTAGLLDTQAFNAAVNAQISLVRNNNAQNINDSAVLQQ